MSLDSREGAPFRSMGRTEPRAEREHRITTGHPPWPRQNRMAVLVRSCSPASARRPGSGHGEGFRPLVPGNVRKQVLAVASGRNGAWKDDVTVSVRAVIGEGFSDAPETSAGVWTPGGWGEGPAAVRSGGQCLLGCARFTGAWGGWPVAHPMRRITSRRMPCGCHAWKRPSPPLPDGSDFEQTYLFAVKGREGEQATACGRAVRTTDVPCNARALRPVSR